MDYRNRGLHLQHRGAAGPLATTPKGGLLGQPLVLRHHLLPVPTGNAVELLPPSLLAINNHGHHTEEGGLLCHQARGDEGTSGRVVVHPMSHLEGVQNHSVWFMILWILAFMVMAKLKP